jgi:hypothetical protein
MSSPRGLKKDRCGGPRTGVISGNAFEYGGDGDGRSVVPIGLVHLVGLSFVPFCCIRQAVQTKSR